MSKLTTDAHLGERFRQFLRTPWASGVILLAFVALAMLLSNLPATKELYHQILTTKLSISIGKIYSFSIDIEKFINDGLMRLRKIDANHSLAEVNLPKEWEGKTLIGVNMRKLYKINLLTIRRGTPTEITGAEGVLSQPESPVIDSPDPSIEFKRGDVLVIFGKNDDLQDFVKKFNL
jgi:hypothetical protein